MNPRSEEELPASPGCYVLIGNSGVVYVGQTTNVRNRFLGHGWEFTDSGIMTRLWGLLVNARLKVRLATRYGEQAMAERRLLARGII